MSNVKEAYNLVFGNDGPKRTNKVLTAFWRNGANMLDPLADYTPWGGGPQYLTAGDFSYTLETFQRLEQ